MSYIAPQCPVHHVSMRLRIARKRRHAGKKFFGCPKFPQCKEIINYDESIHGPISEETEERLQRAERVPSIEIPPLPPRKRLTTPIHFQARPATEHEQCKFFQNMALPEGMSDLINRSRIGQSNINALSQWRLDYPIPSNTHPFAETQSVLAVVEKILLRGSITICSPNVQAFIDEKFTSLDESDEFSLDAIERVSVIGSDPYEHDCFDSPEEETFYRDVLPDICGSTDILAWTIPQVSLSSLTSHLFEAGREQRVDFVISHPKGRKVVVEIDGPQHESSREADDRRDQILESSGYQVVRIPTKEIQNRNGPMLNQLQDVLSQDFLSVSLSELNPAQLSIMASRAAGQIQVTLLEAAKSGHLSLFEDPTWIINVPKPDWFQGSSLWSELVNCAVDDFIALFSSIYRLHLAKELQIIKIIAFEIDFNKSLKTNGVSIDFGKTIKRPGIFKISNMYFDGIFSHSLPISDPVRIEDPDHDVVEYLLYYIFRKDTFWEGQWEGIQRTLQGKDSILLLPTGGGKSIAFQLASLLLPGPCLVVDPLIALINDQLDNLRGVGIDRAVGITSQLSLDERNVALKAFSQGNYLFCYVAPERLQMEDFREALRAVTTISPISVVAIDEAHCVSEWGHDFRTSYLNIARNARKFCEYQNSIPPLLGLTGTASRSVLKDVQRELQIGDFDAIVTPQSFDRPELNFRVVHCSSTEKNARLIGFLSALPEMFQISRNVFFTPRSKDTMAGLIFYPHVNGDFGITSGFEEVKTITQESGIYSGKSPKYIADDQWEDIKGAYADLFKHNEISSLICTSAFGMGIDKPNIRYTVHMNLPRSIEAFYQEAGRAGRDRKRSECMLIVSNDNPKRTNQILDPTTSLEEIIHIMEDLPREEADDITRMMYFHVGSFKGIQEEHSKVLALIEEIVDLSEMRTVTIPFSRETRNECEKAVHRLVILSVIDDYVVDYSGEEIEIRLSGADKETILESFLTYIGAYNRRTAKAIEDRVRPALSMNDSAFLEYMLSQLLEFIYNTVELGRRRSLAEMLQASSSENSDSDIRKHILNYLELGQFSEILDAAMEQAEDLPGLLEELIEEIPSPADAAELRGQTARMLESYPDNPALLFIRALAELLCRDRDLEVLVVNFRAGLQYGLSETGWGMSTEEVSRIVSILAERARFIDIPISHMLLRQHLAMTPDQHDAARQVIDFCSVETAVPAARVLLGRLSMELTAFLGE